MPLQVHYYPEALPTVADTMSELTRRSATDNFASEGFAEGPYVAARVRFEPATFRTLGTDPTTEPW